MEDIKYIILCWILTFLMYGLIRLWDRKYMKKYNEEDKERVEKENEKSIEKGQVKQKKK